MLTWTCSNCKSSFNLNRHTIGDITMVPIGTPRVRIVYPVAPKRCSLCKSDEMCDSCIYKHYKSSKHLDVFNKQIISLDLGNSIISRWKKDSPSVDDNFKSEVESTREYVNLCARKLRSKDYYVTYNGFMINQSDIVEIRKYINEKKKRHDKSKNIVTKRTLQSQIVAIRDNLVFNKKEENQFLYKMNFSKAWMNPQHKDVKGKSKPVLSRELNDDLANRLSYMSKLGRK